MKPTPSFGDIGSRVSIRLHDPEGGFRDLLGHLVAINQVRKKTGQIITFDPSQIALWKIVPTTVLSTNIFLYDTKSRSQRELTISDGKALRMYCCGPTVYRDAHVGNLRTFLLADLITRLAAIGDYDVRSIQNITDVGHLNEDFEGADEGEDKVLKEAHALHVDPLTIARSYEANFHKDLERLGITPADIYPRASESIELMQRLIQQLIDSNHAYIGSDGSVYFAATTFDSYGAISGNKLDSLKPGHRYEYTGDGEKHFHADWALWKSSGNRTEMVWDSPWGVGFPGWHIECSAMSLHYLHGHVDLHLGGIDLRFPHHENERAQSNAGTLSEVTDQWVHGEHLLFEGRKMSKSAGNVVLLQDLIDRGFDPLALRLVFLENKYRSQMDLTWSQISAADSTIRRWRHKYQEWTATEIDSDPDVAQELAEEIYTLLRNDLDTPKALIKLRAIERDLTLSAPTKALLFEEVDRFFGLDISRIDPTVEISKEAQELLQLRSEARATKDFRRSDELRDQLLASKIRVHDDPDGQWWEFIP